MQEISAENLFARSWTLLTQNWSIIVPGLLVAIVAGALTWLLLPTTVYVGPDTVSVSTLTGGFRSFAALVVQVLGAIVAISYTTGMAAAAWVRGTAILQDGAAAFRREGGKVFTALLALFVALVVAAILAPFTLGISLLIFAFLFLYTMAAAVVGDHGGFAALGESYRMATRRVQTTIIIVVGLGVVFVLAGLLGAVLGAIPILGPLVAEIISQIALAYFALVIVGEYLAQSTAAPPIPPA